jgi:hypothetical protein
MAMHYRAIHIAICIQVYSTQRKDLPIEIQLAHKGRKVVVLEILWNNLGGEPVGILDGKGCAIVRPEREQVRNLFARAHIHKIAPCDLPVGNLDLARVDHGVGLLQTHTHTHKGE